ncbi:hypothetical protein pdam_00023268 [Pocillopora damicornis]|uniref:Uncharacterized protein n=1 Tax=Pocillopora damicornis TaxID=46731 RepID=A0A3M6T8U9_POCDA|nr:hypothetical protein pdam_00023268 [Pocillopora damicornis]
MTAQEQMKKMLDELMGTQRDGARPEDEVKFSDDRVCKSYLMGLCPHELFNNTKMDLGPCNKIHEAALKADFEIASKKRDYGYDVDQMEHLQSFIKDCDRKIQIAKKRLEETQDDHDNVPEAQAVHDLAEQIGKKLAEAETVGAEGKVEESMELMKEVEDLKVKKKMAEDIYRESLPSSSLQQQKLRVCEVCAAYLSLYDNDRRLADHFGGKLHMGFIKIRDRLKELQDGVAKKRSEREMERIRRREEREREREQEKRDRATAAEVEVVAGVEREGEEEGAVHDHDLVPGHAHLHRSHAIREGSHIAARSHARDLGLQRGNLHPLDHPDKHRQDLAQDHKARILATV